MGWLDPTHLMFLLVALAIVAALSLHVASVVAQAKRRRSRRFFVVGFSAGWVAATVFSAKRRRKTLHALMHYARRA